MLPYRLRCHVCEHEWTRRVNHSPQRCPSCRTRAWAEGHKIKTRDERFWEKVQKGAGCWEWIAGRFSHGYGQFRDGPTNRLAHRVAWEMAHGPIPYNLYVCHHCDNRTCVREDHLFLGTAKDNMTDCVAKGRIARGETSGRAKLTWGQVRAIRRLYGQGWNQVQLAAAYGMSDRQISNIVRRAQWKEELQPKWDVPKEDTQ